MSKRHKIIVTSTLLSLILLSTWFVPLAFYITYKFFFIGFIGFLSFILSIWSLWEGLNKLKGLILMILPTLFTLSIVNYFFLLPARWLAFPVAFIFGLIFYALLLSQNVFSVASTRTIPLYRVASTTVFVLTLITSFILYNVIFSLDLMFIWNGVAVFGLSFLLVLQILWTIEMEGISKIILTYTTILALVIGEVGLVLSFWPLFDPMAALMLSTILFICLGIATHMLRDRLDRGVVWEYVGWGVLISLVAAITTSWVG